MNWRKLKVIILRICSRFNLRGGSQACQDSYPTFAYCLHFILNLVKLGELGSSPLA